MISKKLQKICKDAAAIHRGYKLPFSQYRWWYKLYLLYCLCMRKLCNSAYRTRWSSIRLSSFILLLFVAGIYGGVLTNPLHLDFSSPFVIVSIGGYILLYFLGMALYFQGDEFCGTMICLAGLFVVKSSFRNEEEIAAIKKLALAFNVTIGAYLGGTLSAFVTTDWLAQIMYAIPSALLWASLGIIVAHVFPSCEFFLRRIRDRFLYMGVDFGGPD
jgi:hypothetical protein